MRYALLIHEDESRYSTMPDEEHQAILAAYARLQADMQHAGVYLGANRLRPTPTATSLRIRSGKTLITDGPFAETKEQLGGLILIDVKNLDEALAWAERIPGARVGSIEVRPIWI